MKISVLTVTENRPEFLPWLLWNYERLDWKDKELVLVDSSEKPLPASKRKGINYHHVAGANVPEKRNVAMQAAGGDFITWLDDDDWRHPDSLKVLAEMAADTPLTLAGGRRAWFFNLETEATRRFVKRTSVLFCNLLLSADVAVKRPFDVDMERGSDVQWLEDLPWIVDWGYTYEVPSLILCHDRNLGNRAEAHYFNRDLADFLGFVTRKAWGDTPKQLEALRSRLRGN